MSDSIRTTFTLLPKGGMIGQSEETRPLYDQEERRNVVIKITARELAKVLGHSEKEFWDKTMPEELLSILDNYQREYSIAAAVSYLTKLGFVVQGSGNVKNILTYVYENNEDGEPGISVYVTKY